MTVRIQCATCKCEFGIPEELHTAARAHERINFYCPYGHSNVFRTGETEADKLRRERDRLAQRIAEKDDEIVRLSNLRHEAERSAAAFKGQVTKIKNRVGHGICPCCNRTFENLSRHMHSKHPDYAKQTETNVVPLKAA